ncbi:MAG TPA: enoyl-CoA hydratase-related protein [Saprospiraceae bacterium]|nr:enoyl-CoA hydratase-related protein [Saprospiraceae bacterium]
MSDWIKTTFEDNIAILTIDRPESLNAINVEVMESIQQFFSERHLSFPDLKGVVITGSGSKAFVAGADIKGFSTMDSKKGEEIAAFGHQTFDLIEHFHCPVIAAVNGFALGGGCELAMACHMRIAGEHAKFGQPEVNLGLIPGYGGTQRLIQLIGKGKALELLLTGNMIDASEALRLGMVNYVVPTGLEVEMAVSILKKTGSKGPLAIAKIIESVNAYFDYGKPAFVKEYKNFGILMGTHDAKEGAEAFISKRKPVFKGK